MDAVAADESDIRFKMSDVDACNPLLPPDALVEAVYLEERVPPAVE